MKTIVIPDLHQRIDWVKPTVEAEKPDRIVFLGDVPDARGGKSNKDTAVTATAAFMKEWLLRDDVVWIMGNHEAHYALPAHRPMDGPWAGAGWKKRKHILFNKALHLLWARMKFFHFEQGWLLSHAGFRIGLAHPILGFDQAWLEEEGERQMELAKVEVAPWTIAGDARSNGDGRGILGGVFWLDWENEFQPIDGINQIVGHSTGDEPRWKNGPASRNLNLDTGGRHYAIIENGEVTVKPVIFGEPRKEPEPPKVRRVSE